MINTDFQCGWNLLLSGFAGLNRYRIMIEAGIFLALALALEYLGAFIPRLPQGGRLFSLSMIPLMTFSFMRGGGWGMSMGACLGILTFYQDQFAIHPVQYLLDYPIAFALAGSVGFVNTERNSRLMYPAILAGNLLRFLSHLISGVVFFRAYMHQISAVNPWIYSAIYNSVFILPTTLLCWITVPLIVRKMRAYRAGRD